MGAFGEIGKRPTLQRFFSPATFMWVLEIKQTQAQLDNLAE